MTAQISVGPFGTLTARAAIAWSDRIYRKLSSCMRAWNRVPKTFEEKSSEHVKRPRTTIMQIAVLLR
jgi:hypothetical protein